VAWSYEYDHDMISALFLFLLFNISPNPRQNPPTCLINPIQLYTFLLEYVNVQILAYK